MAEWLPATGIGYRWEERLGGRRRLPPEEPVADAWWTVAQFAAYAAHTRTAEFAAALDEVLAEASAATVAVMCSESVWGDRKSTRLNSSPANISYAVFCLKKKKKSFTLSITTIQHINI